MKKTGWMALAGVVALLSVLAGLWVAREAQRRRWVRRPWRLMQAGYKEAVQWIVPGLEMFYETAEIDPERGLREQLREHFAASHSIFQIEPVPPDELMENDLVVYLMDPPAKLYSARPCLIAYCQSPYTPSEKERQRDRDESVYWTALFLHRDVLTPIVLSEGQIRQLVNELQFGERDPDVYLSWHNVVSGDP